MQICDTCKRYCGQRSIRHDLTIQTDITKKYSTCTENNKSSGQYRIRTHPKTVLISACRNWQWDCPIHTPLERNFFSLHSNDFINNLHNEFTHSLYIVAIYCWTNKISVKRICLNWKTMTGIRNFRLLVFILTISIGAKHTDNDWLDIHLLNICKKRLLNIWL